MTTREQQNIQQFAQEWERNEQLQQQFSQNPERVCKQYHIEGKQKQTLLNASRQQEGRNLKERVSAALVTLAAKA